MSDLIINVFVSVKKAFVMKMPPSYARIATMKNSVADAFTRVIAAKWRITKQANMLLSAGPKESNYDYNTIYSDALNE